MNEYLSDNLIEAYNKFSLDHFTKLCELYGFNKIVIENIRSHTFYDDARTVKCIQCDIKIEAIREEITKVITNVFYSNYTPKIYSCNEYVIKVLLE